jgi:HNH endonuclease
MARPNVTAELLREFLIYEPGTGRFIRAKKSNRRVVVGSRADFESPRGYARVSVNKARIYAHQAAWIMTFGELPPSPMQIDHINGIKSDNRIANLRAVTPSINSQNERVSRSTNRSGLLGAHWSKHRRKWRASIRILGKRVELGFFETAMEAHEKYLEAKRKLHHGCTI